VINFSFCQFKKGDIYFNYGCFPQTWEDPTYIHPDAEGCRGDNDPLDVVEIGARIVAPGVSETFEFGKAFSVQCTQIC
jgi:inorganic pyrophosphatase